MSGAGVKKFVSGETLTDSHVNSYLMDQAIALFANQTVRDLSYGPFPLPSLSEGMFCYLADVDEIQYYDGSSWQSAPQFVLEDGAIDELKIVDGAVTNQKISNTSIVDSDISGSAEIQPSKLQSGPASSLIMAGAGGTITSNTLSGDISISVAGNTQFPAGTIINSEISSTAEIDPAKFADIAIYNKTASHPITLIDANSLVEFTSSSNLTLTIPLDSTVAFPVGSQVMVVRNGPGEVQIVGATDGVNTVSVISASGFFLRARYSVATLIKRDTNQWYLIGDTRS